MEINVSMQLFGFICCRCPHADNCCSYDHEILRHTPVGIVALSTAFFIVQSPTAVKLTSCPTIILASLRLSKEIIKIGCTNKRVLVILKLT